MEAINSNKISGLVVSRLAISLQREMRALGATTASLEAIVRGEAGCRILAAADPLCDIESAFVRAANELESWLQKGIRCVALGENEYPELLCHTAEPPFILFYRGELSELSKVPAIAIVGSRRADVVGIETAHHFAQEFARHGACVVSGLALGIDSAAHRGALEAKVVDRVPTVAVLGSGLSYIYPSSNVELACEILANGGVLLSQFEPDERPFPSNFLNRNRVISGLASATVVIQAGERSGALVTARHAVEQGREVLVVPGAINDLSYAGSNGLIKQGAYLVLSPEDVWEVRPELKCREVPATELADLSPLQEQILRCLRAVPALHYDALHSEIDHAAQYPSELLGLEMRGLVIRSPGNYVCLGVRNSPK